MIQQVTQQISRIDTQMGGDGGNSIAILANPRSPKDDDGGNDATTIDSMGVEAPKDGVDTHTSGDGAKDAQLKSSIPIDQIPVILSDSDGAGDDKNKNGDGGDGDIIARVKTHVQPQSLLVISTLVPIQMINTSFGTPSTPSNLVPYSFIPYSSITSSAIKGI